MSESGQCEECRAIVRDIADALGQTLATWADPEAKKAQIAAFYARLADDGDPGRGTLRTVDPAILDLNQLHKRRPEFKQDSPLARALSRKFKHEGQTGHKITFPPKA